MLTVTVGRMLGIIQVSKCVCVSVCVWREGGCMSHH